MRNALLLVSSTLFLFACSGAVTSASRNQRGTPVEVAQSDAGDAKITVAAGDSIDILISGGMPAYCVNAQPGQYYSGSTRYQADLGRGFLTLSSTPSCPDSDGGTPLSTSKNVSLTASDEATILSLANALTLLTVQFCGADAPDQRVTITHAGASESWLVDDAQNSCAPGDTEIRSTEYGLLMDKLNALLQ